MAVAKRDPWLEIGEPVDAQQPDQQAMGTGAQPTAQPTAQSTAQPANDPFAAIATPVDPNQPAEVVDNGQSIGGFADELPHEAASKMSPEDEAELVRILSTEDPATAASHARQFVASRGHTGGGDNFDEIVAGRLKGHKIGSTLIYKIPDAEQSGQPLGAGPASVRGAAGIISPINTIDSALNAVKDTVTDGGSLGDNFHKWEDINYGILQNDEANHPTARLVGQLIGGLAIPSGAHGRALAAGTDVLRAGGTMREARAAAAVAARNQVIKEGAAIGANEGFDTAAPGQGLEGAAEGAVVGGAGGAAIGTAGQVLAPRLAAKAAAARALPANEEKELVAAAGRQDVGVLPADVGGPMTRRLASVIGQTMAGGRPLKTGAIRMTGEAKAARDRAAATIGEGANSELAGETAASGARSYMRTSASRIGRIYDIAGAQAGDTKLPLPNAKAVLDEQIARLKAVPGGGVGLKDAEDLRAALEGSYSVQGVRDMRTEMFVAPDYRGTPVERRLKQVVDAAATDISEGLTKAGKPEAAATFKAADEQWKERLKTISRVIEPIIGKSEDRAKSGEEIVQGLERAAKGNGRRLEGFIKALPEEEQSIVRASLIQRMGQVTSGRQGSEGTDFSLNDFLTHWNNVGERAKNVVFGPEARSALNDLAKIAEGTKEAQGYHNLSNTGGVVAGLATGSTMLGGFPLLLKTLAVQYGMGRMLASPRIARFIARWPKAKSPTEYIAKLGPIARSEPAIASDVLSLQQRLTEAFGTTPMKAAASDKKDSEQTPQ